MEFDDTAPDPDLTPEQRLQVAQLTDTDIREVDDSLYSMTDYRWRKTAFVIARTMLDSRCREKDLADIFYAMRIRHLVAMGVLESQGHPDRMRYCEVRRHPGRNVQGQAADQPSAIDNP